jgi:hypothetical protein
MELNFKRSAKAPVKRAGSNDGEHEREDHVGLFGNGGGVAGIRSETDAAQEDMLEAADEAGPVAESQRLLAHSKVTIAIMAKLFIMVPRIFFLRTRPP